MGDTTKHGEALLLRESETGGHPGEEVGEGEVASLDTLGDTLRSTRERECAEGVRAEEDAGLLVGKVGDRGEDVLAVVGRRAASELAGGREGEGRDDESERLRQRVGDKVLDDLMERAS